MSLKPGLLVIHGNRVEELGQVVFDWLEAHPLEPLEEEVVLVQSNGMAEWFKMAMAEAQGVCAAQRVELPARFMWRTYRAVLGRTAVPFVLATDKHALVWRLMSQLPQVLGEVRGERVFSPLRAMLGGAMNAVHSAESAERRLALCQRIADAFDAYQVYRADWLSDWSEGRDVLRQPFAAGAGGAVAVPEEHLWQPALWRHLWQSLTPQERASTRPVLQQRCLAALNGATGTDRETGPHGIALPRRVVLFGTTQLPHQTLELLAAMAGRVQIIMAVPNPCRYFWSDLIEGREQLGGIRRRHPLRAGKDLSGIPIPQLHAFGHPLLAAWGRQARDFIRQLDAFDDAQRSREHFDIPRIDLFDDRPGQTLLEQVQARIRDGVPLAEHPRLALAADDRSIGFHVAHSAQREVEVLHDQLLSLLADPPGGAELNPRDIVVMVPDIETFAPAIRAVFGQHPRGEARFIPWGIADVSERAHSPLLQAVEWLLRVPQHRFSVSQWRDLLELPACRQRLGLRPDDVELALQWLAGSGVRWGLHGEQRAALGLQAAGDVGSWRFGFERMLLGFAAGELESGFEGVEPFTEVAGLSAGVAGVLAGMARALEVWWADAQSLMRPQAWAERARQLLVSFFEAADDADRAVLSALDEALANWLQACETAGFAEAVPLGVLRESWLGTLQPPGDAQRFKAGGVTFCTLLPMRAIPFEVVCLLGMNEGDYPRAAPPSDLDLISISCQSRPGDRSRRDDDRQLMLDALLSARRVLHISWTGRSQRDNTAQPPSVLVAQLRDYLDAGWGEGVCAQRTVEHPLQAFSRRYFEVPGPQGPVLPPTFAWEWRHAHAHERDKDCDGDKRTSQDGSSHFKGEDSTQRDLSLAVLTAFLRNPVKAFFRERLQVIFADGEQTELDDDESFGTSGLERSQWVEVLLEQAQRQPLELALRRLQRQGRLPLGSPGEATLQELRSVVLPMLAERDRVLAAHPVRAEAVSLSLRSPAAGWHLVDDVQGLWRDDSGEMWACIRYAHAALMPKNTLRKDKLLGAWLQCLATAAAGQPAQCLLIGTDVVAAFAPADPAEARDTLLQLTDTVVSSLAQACPLATAPRTALAWLEAQQAAPDQPDKARKAAQKVYDGHDGYARGEGQESCLQRTYPSFESLFADPGFETSSRALYGVFLNACNTQLQIDALPDASALAGTDDD